MHTSFIFVLDSARTTPKLVKPKEFATRFSKKCSGTRTNQILLNWIENYTHQKVLIIFILTKEEPLSAKTTACFFQQCDKGMDNLMHSFSPLSSQHKKPGEYR